MLGILLCVHKVDIFTFAGSVPDAPLSKVLAVIEDLMVYFRELYNYFNTNILYRTTKVDFPSQNIIYYLGTYTLCKQNNVTKENRLRS